jgi:hypothetical protein
VQQSARRPRQVEAWRLVERAIGAPQLHVRTTTTTCSGQWLTKPASSSPATCVSAGSADHSASVRCTRQRPHAIFTRAVTSFALLETLVSPRRHSSGGRIDTSSVTTATIFLPVPLINAIAAARPRDQKKSRSGVDSAGHQGTTKELS